MEPAPLPAPGDVVAGHTLLRKAGEGGAGIVYKARNGACGFRAVKLLRPEKADRPEEVEAFRQEARATSAARHESVVEVHACGVEDGVHYLVMEFVDGPPLDRLLHARGRLPWRVAAGIAIAAARALGHAHGLGFLHRDVKPGNVLLYRDGRPRLIDFGIVKEVRTARDFLRKGRKVGTPAYASPEQCLGKRLTPATDVYSLGATLYHMVCGRPPFAGGGGRAVAARHVMEEPAPATRLVPDVPKSLSNLLARMLAKRPTERPRAMSDVARDLRAILRGQVVLGLEERKADPDALRGLRRTRSARRRRA